MTSMLSLLATSAETLTACGLFAVVAGALAVRRFAGRQAPTLVMPAVTVLKPLCGDEPRLEEALATICDQDYPSFQIVFGVTDADDPALEIVRRIQTRNATHDIAVVVDAAAHGTNRKIANLLNMMRAAKHDTLVFSDSDLHVPVDYLRQVVGTLQQPRTGLVTTACVGLPTASGPIARLGATAITHSFLPSVLLSRALGRADCLGTTMALRRDTLARIGGLHVLAGHVGDDNILGRRVRRLGLKVGLARSVPMTAVPETSLPDLWQHELRWARTIRALEPFLFATSIIQYPLFWAALAIGLTGASAIACALFAAAWLIRALAALSVDRSLRPTATFPFWLLPLRDIMSASIVLASYTGARVVWRGHVLRVAGEEQIGALPQTPPKALPLETFP